MSIRQKLLKPFLGVSLAVVLCASVMTVPAFAYNAHFFFDFSKGVVHKCGPVSKDDEDSKAYITLHYSPDNNFNSNSRLGTRVRTTSGGAATNYHTWNSYGPKQMYYIANKRAGWYYNLHGMVDDSSRNHSIRIWGYWCP